MRRVVLLLVAAAIMSVGLMAGTADAAKKPAKITDCKKDKNLNANIAKAFDTYLAGDTTAAKMQFIQDGDKVAPISDEGSRLAAANGQTNTTTATQTYNLQAKCDSKTAATFTYDLGTVPKPVTAPPTKGFGLNFGGDAVLDKKKGVWLISAATVCDLIGQNPQTPGLGDKCLQAIGG